jgi:hypothetical protein
MNFLVKAVPALAISGVMGMSSVALAHPGHDPFDSAPETVAKAKTQSHTHAVGPVIFTSVQNIEQSSTMEVWAGLRFKAYYHLTITGARNNEADQIKRTFTFEVANETKDRKRARRGFAAKGAISAKTYVRKITACRNLAEKAMSNPAQYDFRVENRGRKSAACRLINTLKPKRKLNPDADAPTEIAKRDVKSHKGSV